MRFLTAIAALAALLVVASCGGGSNATAPRTCAGLRRPGVPLVFAPAKAPTFERARCIGLQYAAVIGRQSWGTLPRIMHRASPGLAAWQERSLLYACNACGLAGFGLDWVRAHHADWIMHSVQGTEVHPQRHPNWVLLDFTDPAYQSAWAVHVRKSLAAGGWTGVDLIDAGNDPDWSDVPVDPSTGQPMTEPQRRQDLADALTSRAGGAEDPGLLAAGRERPAVDRQLPPDQQHRCRHARTRLRAPHRRDWDGRAPLLPAGRQLAVGAYVAGSGPPLAGSSCSALRASCWSRSRATRRTSLRPGPTCPCTFHPGTPPDTPPTAVGPAWVRTYPNAVVAVNPCRCRRHRRDGCGRAGHDGAGVGGDRDGRAPDHDRLKPFVYYRPTQGMVPAALRCM